MRLLQVVLGAALIVAGCGNFDKERKARKMERILEDRTERRLGVEVAGVDCPRDVELDDGVRVTCFARIGDPEEKVELSVRWHSDPARASMRLPSRWRLSAGLRMQLAAKYEAQIDAVICPKEITPKKDAVIACAARVKGGEVPLTVEVTFTNDEGSYMWHDKGVVLMRKLEAVVAESIRKRGRPGKVACAGAIRSSQPGTIFRCPIAFKDGDKGKVVVQVKSWEGDIGFEVE